MKPQKCEASAGGRAESAEGALLQASGRYAAPAEPPLSPRRAPGEPPPSPPAGTWLRARGGGGPRRGDLDLTPAPGTRLRPPGLAREPPAPPRPQEASRWPGKLLIVACPHPKLEEE